MSVYIKTSDGLRLANTKIATSYVEIPNGSITENKISNELLDKINKKADESAIVAKINAFSQKVDTTTVNNMIAGKADEDSVTSRLAQKADTEEVIALLGQKADEVSVATRLAQKADKSDIDRISTDNQTITNRLALKADEDSVVKRLAQKADEDSVTERFAQKADTETVITMLQEKADEISVATRLAEKADKSDVDRILTDTGDNQTITNRLALKADEDSVAQRLEKKADEDSVTERLAKKASTERVIEWLSKKADEVSVANRFAEKADEVTMENRLADKADEVSVADRLSTKADTAEMTSALAQKADMINTPFVFDNIHIPKLKFVSSDNAFELPKLFSLDITYFNGTKEFCERYKSENSNDYKSGFICIDDHIIDSKIRIIKVSDNQYRITIRFGASVVFCTIYTDSEITFSGVYIYASFTKENSWFDTGADYHLLSFFSQESDNVLKINNSLINFGRVEETDDRPVAGKHIFNYLKSKQDVLQLGNDLYFEDEILNSSVKTNRKYYDFITNTSIMLHATSDDVRFDNDISIEADDPIYIKDLVTRLRKNESKYFSSITLGNDTIDKAHFFFTDNSDGTVSLVLNHGVGIQLASDGYQFMIDFNSDFSEISLGHLTNFFSYTTFPNYNTDDTLAFTIRFYENKISNAMYDFGSVIENDENPVSGHEVYTVISELNKTILSLQNRIDALENK